jgi:hypothetical protein
LEVQEITKDLKLREKAAKEVYETFINSIVKGLGKKIFREILLQ